MRYKLSTAQYAQGWIEGQIENIVSNAAANQNGDPIAHLIASQLQEQWSILSVTFDQLVNENAELNRKMAIIESTFL